MRNHRVVLGVGVLLDVEVLLNSSIRIREESPLGTNRRTELLNCVVVVCGNGCDLGIRNHDFRIERGKFQMLLVFLWAVVAAREREDQRVVALQFTQPAQTVAVIGQFVVRKYASGDNIRTHAWTPSLGFVWRLA